MRILIYIPYVTRVYGGVYQYTIALLNLLKSDPHNEFYIFSKFENEEIELLAENYSNISTIPPYKCNDRKLTTQINRLKSPINKVFKKIRLPIFFAQRLAIHRVVKSYNIDIIHSPYDTYPVDMKIPGIVTIHDLQELHFPAYFSPAQRINRAIAKNKIINSSTAVFCSYNHIEEDLHKFFPTTKDKTHVVLLEMDNLWFKSLSDDDIINMDKLGLDQPFILCPAATWEHKNHKSLIKAFEKLADDDPNICLVCTGKKTDFFEERLKGQISKSKHSERIFFTDVVSDAELYSYYQHTLAVVVPTMYEAGSFPLMESMLMGIPVVCSNVTSLPETIGNEEFTFDPNSVEDMSQKMSSICYDQSFRSRNLKNSEKKCKRLGNTGALDVISKAYMDIRH